MKSLYPLKSIIFAMAFAVLVSVNMAFAQLNTNLVASNADLNQCGPITLTVLVSGGSGNYTYGWSATPSSGAIIEDVPSITVTPSTVTNFRCIVFDLNTGLASLAQVSVVPDLTGEFDIFVPNIITPNGDGFNDLWEVRDADVGFGPINAFRYELSIVDRNGRSVFSRSQSLTTGAIGFLGGDIFWDGRRNGSLVPDGTYFYSLRLINCSLNRNIQGTISVLGSSSSIASDELVSIHPNPSRSFVEISIQHNDRLDGDIQKSQFVPYEVVIHDKSGNALHTETVQGRGHTIDLSRFSPGMYYLVGEYNGEPFQKRLIIED